MTAINMNSLSDSTGKISGEGTIAYAYGGHEQEREHEDGKITVDRAFHVGHNDI